MPSSATAPRRRAPERFAPERFAPERFAPPRPALRRANLEGTRFHSLRHSCAALLVEAGAHPKLVQSQLGHSSIRTTMDQYAFVMPGLDDRLAERLDEGLGEALAPQERPRAINA